jgi:hypothetical protein
MTSCEFDGKVNTLTSLLQRSIGLCQATPEETRLRAEKMVKIGENGDAVTEIVHLPIDFHWLKDQIKSTMNTMRANYERVQKERLQKERPAGGGDEEDDVLDDDDEVAEEGTLIRSIFYFNIYGTCHIRVINMNVTGSIHVINIYGTYHK